MYRTCIDLIHKHELKSKKKNTPKDQKIETQKLYSIKNNKIKQLKLQEKYYKELLTLQEKHDLTKRGWIQKLK